MIEESLLDEWIAHPELMSRELISMVVSQLKAIQRNTTIIYVFPQAFFEGNPDNAITPEKLRGFILEKSANADLYFAGGVSRLFDRSGDPVSNPPAPIPAPTKITPIITKRITVQDVINAFYSVFGNDYWTHISAAGLSDVLGNHARKSEFTMHNVLPDEVKKVL
jgi:hypothetical protein